MYNPSFKGEVCSHRHAFFLDNFIRRIFQNPKKIVGPYIRPGDTVIDLGCGPGYFTGIWLIYPPYLPDKPCPAGNDSAPQPRLADEKTASFRHLLKNGAENWLTWFQEKRSQMANPLKKQKDLFFVYP